MMQEADFTMDRRKALAALLTSIGATAALTACDGGLFALGEGEIDAGPFYSTQQLELLTRYADTIIPATETPGALAAGAIEQMESLMRHWASHERREQHQADWKTLDETLTALIGSDPVAAEAEPFFTALATIDTAAFDRDVSIAEVSKAARQAHQRQKTFLAEVFYLSEPGATQELQYELNPAEIIPCAPLSEIGRSWAT